MHFMTAKSQPHIVPPRPRDTESGALTRGLSILSCLQEAMRPMGLQELSAAVGLPPSTCHRLLQSLEQAGYLYRQGALHYPAARAACPLPLEHPLNRLRRDTTALMRELQERYGPSALLVAFLGHQRVVVDYIAGSYSVTPYFGTHVTAPLHVSVSGKLLLSDLAPAECDALLGEEPYAARTKFSIQDRKTLDAELDQVRQQGWASNHNENVAGISALGVRLSAPSGRAIGAIVLTGPGRYFGGGKDPMCDDLLQAAGMLNATSNALRAMAEFLGV